MRNNMKLELAKFPVKDARFDKQTEYKSGVLQINKEELLKLVLSDRKIESADLDIAFPGEQTRIVRIRDVVEPRVKVAGPGNVFPGVVGSVETVGAGRTNTLSGATVMVCADYNYQRGLGSGGQNSGIVDMWGPGARLSPYGSLINVVLLLKLVDGVSELDAHTAIRIAQCRVAQRLAETTIDTTPDSIETFELSDVDPSLPRVVYDLTFSTTWHEPVMAVLFYGFPLRESLATFAHPNEFIDGALTVDARRGNGEVPRTWEWMNNPVIMGLFREHGKTLNFLGVILQRTRFEVEQCKYIGAEIASQMARLLGADGVVVTKTSPSGNNSMDLIFTLQAHEKKGMKTVFITPEYGGAEGKEQALWFYAPEADAIVSVGSLDRGHQVPKPAKVIGCEKGEIVEPYPAEPISPWEEQFLEHMTFFTGGIDYLGFMRHTCKAD